MESLGVRGMTLTAPESEMGEISDPRDDKMAPVSCRTKIVKEDKLGFYRSNSHDWLYTAADGRVFQAGPSKMMRWIDLAGNGTNVQCYYGYDNYSQT